MWSLGKGKTVVDYNMTTVCAMNKLVDHASCN